MYKLDRYLISSGRKSTRQKKLLHAEKFIQLKTHLNPFLAGLVFYYSTPTNARPLKSG